MPEIYIYSHLRKSKIQKKKQDLLQKQNFVANSAVKNIIGAIWYCLYERLKIIPYSIREKVRTERNSSWQEKILHAFRQKWVSQKSLHQKVEGVLMVQSANAAWRNNKA